MSPRRMSIKWRYSFTFFRGFRVLSPIQRIIHNNCMRGEWALNRSDYTTFLDIWLRRYACRRLHHYYMKSWVAICNVATLWATLPYDVVQVSSLWRVSGTQFSVLVTGTRRCLVCGRRRGNLITVHNLWKSLESFFAVLSRRRQRRQCG